MGIQIKSRKQSSNFYESFSDLLFCTLVLFLVLIVGLIVRISSETAKVNKKSEYLSEKIADAEERLKKVKQQESQASVEKTKQEREGERLAKWNKQLQDQATNLGNTIARETEKYEKFVQDAETALDAAKGAAADAERAADAARGAAEEARTEEAETKQALAAIVGFKGKIENVVFLLDLSGSMILDLDSRNVDPNLVARFNEVKKDIANRIRHLPFKKFNLIGFSGDGNENVKLISAAGNNSFLNATDESRENAIKQLLSWEAGGGTPTGPALAAAFAHANVDTIFLYTDGAPSLPKQAGDDANTPASVYQLRALELVRQQNAGKRVTINSIAIGAYGGDQGFVDFTRKLAESNNGSYMGR